MLLPLPLPLPLPLILTFQSAFKRAEHRRSGEGEEVRVSERSEFPHRPSTDRGAQGTGVRSTSARGRRSVSLVTFLMAHIRVRHPTGRLRRSTLLLQRGARAKKVTSTITADTKTAPSQVPFQ
ncbi:hypothetical protein BB780_03860 [Stenotrophomonas maltophilia]|nr:hypothetical protein BB780_03860 [Stenotrophomonas maltophilia]